MNAAARLRDDRPLWTLLAANALAFVAAVLGWTDLGTLIWAYWMQSVSIGVFHVVRILSVQGIDLPVTTMDGKPLTDAVSAGKIVFALFFTVHYGFFHLGYLAFIAFLFGFPGAGFLLFGIAFVATHAYSLRKNLERDRVKLKSVTRTLFFPYVRILPMHLTIIFGWLPGIGLPLFVALKTAADLAMHRWEHRPPA